MMNLALHGIEQPAIVRDNALAQPITQIRAADRVDVVLTNPPFGGEEERAIQTNFPEATRTAETALLFVQFVERVLKPGGRCGIVVPNGSFSVTAWLRVSKRGSSASATSTPSFGFPMEPSLRTPISQPT